MHKAWFDASIVNDISVGSQYPCSTVLASARYYYERPGLLRATVEMGIEGYAVEIGQLVSLSTLDAPGTSGYSDKVFRVLEISYTPDEYRCTLLCEAPEDY